jgi:putative transposase
VIRRKTFRFRIYPKPEQSTRLDRWGDALRFLWNIANEQRIMGYAHPKGYRVYPTDFDQINDLTALRAEIPWLADVPRDVSEQLLTSLHNAWQHCFKKLTKRPRWKRKGRDVLGFCETHRKTWRIIGNKLYFPKIGPIQAVVHRPLEGKPKICTIKRDGDQWFASIVCEIETVPATPRTDPVVAIDRGVVNITADSNGRIVESPRYYQRAVRRLARAQRIVSRRNKGSKNREKAKIRVMRLHRKVRRQREHFLHVLSHDYANSHGTVVIEKLQVNNMVKTSKGLARSIFDAGWGMFANMLRYKLAWNGGTLIEVPAAYSSQTCSVCRCVDAKNRVSQSVFLCTACGYSDHADLNAAKVLKSRANRPVLPVEGLAGKEPRRSRKRLLTSASAHPKTVLKEDSMLELKVGDKLRDCDPRANGAVKEVTAFDDVYVWLKRVNGNGPTSRVRRDRIHINAERKKGYFFVGEFHLFAVKEPESIKTEDEDMDVLRRAFERNG